MPMLKNLLAACLAAFAVSVFAQGAPAPKAGDWIARDFRFHTGEVMPELRLHYTTLDEPTGEPILILHGSTGQAIWRMQEVGTFLGSVPRRG